MTCDTMETVGLVLRALPSIVSEVEIVEHKGIGHPDTICDALAETLSAALSRLYLERYGTILHHNVDKALLRGGQSRPAFGGGEVLAPIEIYLSGRAVMEVGGERLPVEELVVEGSRAWLRQHLHALDADRHVEIHGLLRPGSVDLLGLFERGLQAPVALANDTSIGVGYAPLSVLERVVLAAAARLGELPATAREVGEDIKVMGIRRGGALHLTVACAFVDAHLRDLSAYVERTRAVLRELETVASAEAGAPVTVEVNAADDVEHGRAYLTVTGTSAEAGDDGQVGRGNRANGLITPYRPMSLEAVAGKNPVSHVGKLYNVLAHEVAADLVRSVPGVTAAQVRLVSCIGRPIDQPQVVHVEVCLADGDLGAAHEEVDELVRSHLSKIASLTDRFVRGELRVY